MGPIDERHTDQFRRFDLRTRGWQVFSEPVSPEPPFAPFVSHALLDESIADDGRRPTILSSLFKRAFGNAEASATTKTAEEEPEPEFFARSEVAEIPLFLPVDFDSKPEQLEGFVRSLSAATEPIAYELIGTERAVTAQIAVGADDEAQVRQQLRAFFPDVPQARASDTLWSAWDESDDPACVIDFALGREGVFSLGKVAHAPSVPLIGALASLGEREMAAYQVIFQPVAHPWAESLVAAVTDERGRPFFVNAPELVPAAKAKASRPLYGAVLRVLARAPSPNRIWEILQGFAGPLSIFAHPQGNELIPLKNDEYPLEDHAFDVLTRQSRRSGMLLAIDELLGLVSFPARAVVTPKLRRQNKKTKAAPSIATHGSGVVLGTNEHDGEKHVVRLSAEQRTRHMHVIGASGTGKSTLLFRMIREDIESGQGVGIFDPHGDLIDKVLGIIPEKRIGDVVLLDPSDEEFVVGLNLLAAHSDAEKSLLSSDLVSVFRRLSTSWGDQMEIVLKNAILAFLESDRGGTLSDLRRFLLESKFREEFLTTVRDPDVAFFWRHGFSQLSGGRSIGPVLTRLETFLTPKPVRYMVAQRDNRLDIASIIDSGKIFLAKLSHGTFGRENSQMLGSLLVAKIHQAALSRSRQAAAARRDFWLYLDEFPDFMTQSLAEILSGARKYRLGLVLAHQDLKQLERGPEVKSAVMSNAYTRVCFRVGDSDARELQSGFSFFNGADLLNLGTGDAIARVERSAYDFNLSVALPDYPTEQEAAERREAVIAASRKTYGTPRSAAEAATRAQFEDTPAPKETPRKEDGGASTVAAVPPKPPPAAPPAKQAALPHILPQVVSAPAPAKSPSASARPTDPGRGGAQHKAVQRRIKEGAEALGFRVTIEKPVLADSGSVDLVLERSGLTIACEVTVTTTVDHEVGNIDKCRKAGFERIVVVGVDEEKLGRIEQAARASLGAEVAKLVSFFLPDAFLDSLRALPEKPTTTTKIVRGRRVITKFATEMTGEMKAKENDLIRILAESMKRSSLRSSTQ